MRRATTVEELAPLLTLCRLGRLFEVQQWLSDGKPIHPPETAPDKLARRIPLRVAIDSGFHSLVQILLEAGASLTAPRYNALSHAVKQRRPDLAALLIKHGAQVADVPMCRVLEAWDSAMVNLFVANGASLIRGNPVAAALVNKIRPALGLLKKYGPKVPELMKQAEFALRYHVDRGNAKWVALLLWAGADPWSRGRYRIDDIDRLPGEDEYLWSAVQLAIHSGRLDLFSHKRSLLAPDPARTETLELLKAACFAPNCETLYKLLELGHSPQLLPDRGTGAIDSLLCRMTWGSLSDNYLTWDGDGSHSRKGIDSSDSRERLKMLHILLGRGAKWLPADTRRITGARRDLMKMKRDYSIEFVWLMKEYRGARRRDVRELFRTPSMVRHLAEQHKAATQLVEGVPDDPLAEEPPPTCSDRDQELRRSVAP